jgi:hypothetical protein
VKLELIMKCCPIIFLTKVLLAVAIEGSCVAQSIHTPYTFGTRAGSQGGPGSADGTGKAAQFGIDGDDGGPKGIPVDDGGNLYVSDSGNHTIRKITPAEIVTTLAGNIYVMDAGNQLIPIRDELDGHDTCGKAGVSVANDGIGSAARFSGFTGDVVGITADGTGNVYVADSGNNVIRKASPASSLAPEA